MIELPQSRGFAGWLAVVISISIVVMSWDTGSRRTARRRVTRPGVTRALLFPARGCVL
jgi:hypothetical protein